MSRGLLTVTFVLAVLVSGCVRPCVHDRSTIAHPTMTPADISSGVEGRVRAVSEGKMAELRPGE